jgi:hypothetical protein
MHTHKKIIEIAGKLLLSMLFAGNLSASLTVMPTIVVNNQTGSDTAASGAPASMPAIFAAATCHTNGVSSNTIQWPSNGFLAAGVPQDGSAVLWLNTTTNAGSVTHFTRINTYTANTVTVADSQNIAAASAVDCAVGGKRATLADAAHPNSDGFGTGFTRSIGNVGGGWEIQVETTGVTYTHTATLDFRATKSSLPYVWIHGTLGTPVLQWTTNVTGVSGCQGCIWENFRMQNTAAGNSSSTFSVIFGNNQVWRDIVAIGWCGGFATNNNQNMLGYNIEVTGVPSGACSGLTASPSTSVIWLGNYIHDNTSATGTMLGTNGMVALYNVVRNNGSNAPVVDLGSSGLALSMAAHNTVDGHPSGVGINYSNGGGTKVIGNLLTNNSVGLNSTGGPGGDQNAYLIDTNAYFGNTTNYQTAQAGPHDTTGVNPGYVNRAAGDMDLTSAALIGKGFPFSGVAIGTTSGTFTSTEPGASFGPAGGGGANYAY